MPDARRFDWDHLRFLLAIARHGSTIAAAAALGVNQSTVQRRLAQLEQHAGCSLAERLPTGYRLTALGREMVAYAEHMEEAASAFEGRLDAYRREATGVVRVACPEPLVYLLEQSALIERFHDRHPGLRLQFVMSDRYVDLARGEADVALRSGDVDDDTLVGRRIADSRWAVYASRRYIAEHGRPDRVEDLACHRLVGLDESMAGHRAAAWLRAVAPDGQIVARNDSVLGLLFAARSGVGIAPLPTALGDKEETLVRVLGPIAALARTWRILAHPGVRHSAGVAAFFDFVAEEAGALEAILA
jgi:DNA-binding transcriptional LysR family regulator